MSLRDDLFPTTAQLGLPMSTSFRAAPDLVKHAATAATQALEHSQHLAHDALDRVARGAHDVAQQSRDLALRGSRQLRAQASRVSEGTVDYIRDEPLKSVLIAAVAGAALVCLARLAWGRYED
jgi:ElaB/YqjD/DUF883 family membrane-anchored ribosome-binding protein